MPEKMSATELAQLRELTKDKHKVRLRLRFDFPFDVNKEKSLVRDLLRAYAIPSQDSASVTWHDKHGRAVTGDRSCDYHVKAPAATLLKLLEDPKVLSAEGLQVPERQLWQARGSNGD